MVRELQAYHSNTFLFQPLIKYHDKQKWRRAVSENECLI